MPEHKTNLTVEEAQRLVGFLSKKYDLSGQNQTIVELLTHTKFDSSTKYHTLDLIVPSTTPRQGTTRFQPEFLVHFQNILRSEVGLSLAPNSLICVARANPSFMAWIASAETEYGLVGTERKYKPGIVVEKPLLILPDEQYSFAKILFGEPHF